MSSTFLIEDGVPLPKDDGRGRRSGVTAVLRTLKPGQSFSMPVSEYARVSVLVACVKRKSSARFTVRKTGDTLRVWRLEDAQ